MSALHPLRRQILDYLASPDEDARMFAMDTVPEIGDEHAGSLAAGEGHMHLSYGEYLTTSNWLEYRAAIFARQGGKCATCPRDATHCHHRTYEHLGWEADEDCVGLCPDCHRKLHQR